MAPLIRCQRRLLAAAGICVLLALLLLLRQLQQTGPAPLPPPPPPPRGQRPPPCREHFEYLLNAPVCGDRSGIEEPVRAVVVVHSDPRRPEVRRAIRDSLPAEELAKLGVRRAFMVAMASTSLAEGEKTIPQVRIRWKAEILLWLCVRQCGGYRHDECDFPCLAFCSL